MRPERKELAVEIQARASEYPTHAILGQYTLPIGDAEHPLRAACRTGADVLEYQEEAVGVVRAAQPRGEGKP